jgi:alpha-galactosidase
MEKRGPDGRIIPFKNKFPNGLKPLADYIHSKGLKFGVYSGIARVCGQTSLKQHEIKSHWMKEMVIFTNVLPLFVHTYSGSDTGNRTCEGYPGSWGHEKLVSASRLSILQRGPFHAMYILLY